MLPTVYIDGQEGTTGLQIYQRLGQRKDIRLLRIDREKRKDTEERRKFLNRADLVFLCLPDSAAVEAVELIENGTTRVIDASTAHRTAPGWVYGFPELGADRRAAIEQAGRVANPGCHATGFISSVYPLVRLGILPAETALDCFSLTGYSGGGKKMIAQYEDPERDPLLGSPAVYALGQSHKHLAEMKAVCGLEKAPVFCPVVADYYKGMATTVSFHMDTLRGVTSLQQVWEALSDYYAGQKLVRVAQPGGPAAGRLYGGAMAGTDSLELHLAGNDERFTVTALFDNLGKGASGAAVQNMNLMLGFEETRGLSLDSGSGED